MPTPSNQKIVVFCPLHDEEKPEILHGIHWAAVFGRELCLFHPAPSKKQQAEIKQQLNIIARTIIRDLPSLHVSTLVLPEKLSSSINILSKTYNTILFITRNSAYKSKLQALKNSTIPFLFVSSSNDLYSQYQQCIIPIDYRSEIKDAAIWASYFGRFNASTITLFTASDKDHTQQNAIHQHTKNITALMKKVKVIPVIKKSPHSSWSIQKNALKKCLKIPGAFLVILGSRNDSLFDMIIGSPEKRILKRAHKIPVLCVNPRRSVYVMCN